ncbi:hypothetical protein CASFOL_030677 [Castilleja foliolosa]|uniref:Regulatory particle non-ATPase 13 n=1 Tax=Castilleja foliolosa TaxID=1961234 RepID=A0ABD3C608_9LAMI
MASSSSKNDEFRPIQVVFEEFRAGKMLLDGTSVVPDNRKGLFRMGTGEDGLHHIQWLDRDQIIFPGEAVFEKVNQSSERVYILKFLTDDRKFFFWMQEPKADNDAELCNMVNFFLNKPLGGDAKEDESDVSRASNMLRRSMGAEADVTSAGPVQLTDLQPIPKHIVSSGVVESVDQDAGGDAKEDEFDVSVPVENSKDMDVDAIFSRTLDMLSRSMGAEATSDVTSTGPIQLKDLQPILRNIVSSGVVESVDPDEDLGLGDILNPDYVWPLIRGLRSRQKLAPYLPKGRWTPAKLREMLENPPFRQQLDSFTCSLRSGQVDLTQFGIDPSTLPENVTVSSFLEALEDSVARTRESEGSAKGGSDSKSQARDGSDKGQ